MLAQVGDLLPTLGTRISGLEVDDGMMARDNGDEEDNENVDDRYFFDSEPQTNLEVDELGVRVVVGLLVSLIITVLAAVPETRWSANK